LFWRHWGSRVSWVHQGHFLCFLCVVELLAIYGVGTSLAALTTKGFLLHNIPCHLSLCCVRYYNWTANWAFLIA
jgi:hypothetical protein